MSYQGRYATQAPTISGINDSMDSDLPESCRIPDYQPESHRRRCAKCGAILSQYNPETVCRSHGTERKPPPPPKPYNVNSSGLMGVIKHGDRYAAQIFINGKKRHLGMAPTAREAHMLWAAAKMDAQLKQWREETKSAKETK